MEFFLALTSDDLNNLFNAAQRTICYAGPGIRQSTADAIVAAAKRIGPELVTVCLDFDERVFRMGFGDFEAVRTLKDAGITVSTVNGLRMGLAIADSTGFFFTPTALFLETEDHSSVGKNAMRLSLHQVQEALCRFSPAAKAVGIFLAKSEEEKERLTQIQVEFTSRPIEDSEIDVIDQSLAAIPLANFDVARQVRVYNARLQYVELALLHVAIEGFRIAIPASLQNLGSENEVEGLRTTFNLVEQNGPLSSRPLTQKVDKLRKDFTRSIGKKFGRAILKSSKPLFEKRIEEIREELCVFQDRVEAKLQEQLDRSRKAIKDHYAPIAEKFPPDAAMGLFGSNVVAWLKSELLDVFPRAEKLVQKMTLDIQYKDVTFETLKQQDFLEAVRVAFPGGDWDQAHDEYRAAREVIS